MQQFFVEFLGMAVEEHIPSSLVRSSFCREFLGMAVEEHMAAVLKGIALFIGSIDGIFWIPFGDYVFDVGSHLSVSPEKQYYCQKGRRTWNQ